MSHFATLSPGHYVYETKMINSFSLSYFPPAPRLAQPSPILYLPAQRTRPLKSPGEGSLFLPCVSINLLRGRRMLREPKPRTNAESHHLLKPQKWIIYFMHSYLSLSHTGCRKTPSENPMGDLCGDMWYGWWTSGGEREKKNTLNHNTCFILCAIQGTSLLPGSETWPHTEICSFFLGLHNGFLKKTNGKKWPLTVSPLSVPLDIRYSSGRRNSHRCCWKSWCCSGIVPALQRLSFIMYTLQRLSINYSPYNLKWLFEKYESPNKHCHY